MTLYGQPSPAFAGPYVLDSDSVNAEALGEILGWGAPVFFDRERLAFRQLRVPLPLANVRRAVLDLVIVVFKRSSPSKMAGVDAPSVPISARVRGMICGIWGRTIRAFAHDAVSTFVSKDRVPPAVPRKGPVYAVVRFGIGCVLKKYRRASVRRPACERVSVASPSHVVLGTPSTTETAVDPAAINRACSYHIDNCRYCEQGLQP